MVAPFDVLGIRHADTREQNGSDGSI